MTAWNDKFTHGLPYWTDYQNLLATFEESDFPQCDSLTRLLPPNAVNQRGLPIRFVSAGSLPGADYEKHIYEAGEVSTRENSWHDLFNALAWCRFPRLKSALNARHYDESGPEKSGHRGKLRDALTLFDESGVIVYGSDANLLRALSNKDWKTVFVTQRTKWERCIRIAVCGHAILEKFLSPYKSVTAHALLLHTPGPIPISDLDEGLGSVLLEGNILTSPGCLSPLPLMGVPGWWAGGAQDSDFYDDQGVFRPDSGRRAPAPVHKLPIFDQSMTQGI
jgi:hypothetical protein